MTDSTWAVDTWSTDGDQRLVKRRSSGGVYAAVYEYEEPEVFRAAAAVLAPSNELIEIAAERIQKDHKIFVSKDGEMCSCGDYLVDVFVHDVRAVLAALKQHATGGGPNAR